MTLEVFNSPFHKDALPLIQHTAETSMTTFMASQVLHHFMALIANYRIHVQLANEKQLKRYLAPHHDSSETTQEPHITRC